ncbi:hypothetical protein [Caulobacter henricii]|uniref:Uncharacterized protein n=1 Tax=Caulobacter henricii TaxID=69395 RepID=A0A0P0NY35_9CAUL|nr:hypothetical protein [Caulobacter henricii]ALL12681.1 hypothetical protein AQ619_04550 [Caulobacter henricii]
MTDGSVAIGATVRAGVAGLGPSVRACWGALLVAVVLSVVSRQLPPGLGLVALLGEIAAVALACGALYRNAFGRASGLAGLRWGQDEWRLLGVQALVGVFLFVVATVLLLVVGAIALGVARANAPGFDATSSQAWQDALAGSGPGTLVAGAAPLVGLGLLIWLGLRLSLAAAASVDQSGVRVLSAFPLTRGASLQVFVAGLVLAAPIAGLMAVLNLLGRWTGPGLDGGLAAFCAIFGYVYLAPVWTSALVHVYRQRQPAAPLQEV